MPGIVGLSTSMPREWAEPQLARMIETIRHERFYQVGTWIDEARGLYIGWTALKDSFADGMPLHDERTGVTLFFSGEEYSDRHTLAKGSGLPLRSKPCSYLLGMCPEDEFPARLNGLFHGVLLHSHRPATELFNDRYGMHRVYYHEAKEGFYFAAEAKAILAARPELRTPSLRGLGEFVACSCVLEDRTLFNDIFVLPAASIWSLRNGVVEQKRSYFNPTVWEQQDPLDSDSYYEALRDVLSSKLPLYFSNTDEHVGIALTGGMDTRVIMALQTFAPKSLPCYTFGGMFRDCQDVTLARKVARECQQSHTVIPVDGQYLKSFPRYAERTVYLTEGAVDVYRASDLYLSERAREIAPVKVVGTYGSEIVRQCVMFKPMAPAHGTFKPDFLGYLRQACETYTEIKSTHPVTFAAFRQSPWYHHGILALEQSQLTVRSPYLDNSFVQTAFRTPPLDSEDVRLRLIAGGNERLRRIPSDRGVGGNSGPLNAAINHRFLEFTFKAEYAYDYGMPQWLTQIDHMLSPLHLERLFIGRHKFLHYRIWYRDALASYIEETLLDRTALSRPYIEGRTLERMIRSHLKGERNYTTVIHKMLTLELLHRQFFDPK